MSTPRRRIDPPADDSFEVVYLSDDGAEHRVPLARAGAVPTGRQLVKIRPPLLTWACAGRSSGGLARLAAAVAFTDSSQRIHSNELR
jgi:hypothetical protein